MRFQGARALVTGGSSGIGLAIARRLARAGAHVHLVARTPGKLAAATTSLSEDAGAAGARIDATPCDVTDAESVDRLFRALQASGCSPDILVNSAGASMPGRFVEQSLADLERLMRVNYLGTVQVLKHAVPAMIGRRGGHILNIGSVASLVGVYGLSAYCASKFAVRGLTESLRYELKPHGISVSLLCPPDTATPMLDAEVALLPEETAALSRAGGVMTAEAVAAAAVRGMARGTAVIVPGLEARFTALVQRLAPGVVERVSDRIIRSARR